MAGRRTVFPLTPGTAVQVPPFMVGLRSSANPSHADAQLTTTASPSRCARNVGCAGCPARIGIPGSGWIAEETSVTGSSTGYGETDFHSRRIQPRCHPSGLFKRTPKYRSLSKGQVSGRIQPPNRLCMQVIDSHGYRSSHRSTIPRPSASKTGLAPLGMVQGRSGVGSILLTIESSPVDALLFAGFGSSVLAIAFRRTFPCSFRPPSGGRKGGAQADSKGNAAPTASICQ